MQETDTHQELWFEWKELVDTEDGKRLLTPWSDPMKYEEPMDLLFRTVEDAHQARTDFEAEDEDWVLVETTHRVIE